MNYLFEWDTEKAKSNITKHKIKFELASSVFQDPRALTIFDDEHSSKEDRWITIGLASNSQLIVLVHTFLFIDDNNTKIRLISARKATKNETTLYKGDL